jgi:endoglucanase
MKSKIFAIVVCSSFCSTLSYAQEAVLTSQDAEFVIRRGVNISHWLSQSTRRGQERREFFIQKDVEFIASLGFDHIRLPIDEEQLWDEQGRPEAEAFELLENAIEWARQSQLRIIIDLHILRSHHFNVEERPLWTDPKAQENFLRLWRELSARLKKYPTSLVAYEPMNEPAADDAEDWNKLVEKAMRVIRQNEPHRKIVIGSNKWQSVDTFDQLRIPAGDKNIILSFHFYTPMLITHYKAPWTPIGKYTGPVNYPGQIVDPNDIEGLSDDLAQLVRENNGVYDRQKLESLLTKPLELARKLDLPLYCGEWGALPTLPRKARMHWYEDMRSNLEKHNIAWANWDYKGDFGIVSKFGIVGKDSFKPDYDFIKVLLDK